MTLRTGLPTPYCSYGTVDIPVSVPSYRTYVRLPFLELFSQLTTKRYGDDGAGDEMVDEVMAAARR